MRATEYLILVVFIGIFAYLVISGATEMNEIYTENKINASAFEQYTDFSQITAKTNASIENFQKLGDDSKWYQKIGAGIVAIPYAVIQFPILIILAVTQLSKFIGSSLGGFVPYPIILALITLLLIEIVRRFMEFFQKTRA